MTGGESLRSSADDYPLEDRRTPLELSPEEFAKIGHRLVDDVVLHAVGGGDGFYQAIDALDIGCPGIERPRRRGRLYQPLGGIGIFLERHLIFGRGAELPA